MAGEQDIVSLGLDIESFNTEKMTRLRDFISLFDNLAKYDGKIFNPVMGDGLTTFNSSVAQTTQLLDKMNAKLAQLASTNNNVTTSTNKTTQANTELGLSVKEYAKSTDDAAKTSAKLSASSSEQAKSNAALKVELSETRKKLLEEAQANNESYQRRIKAIEARKAEAIAAKNASAEQKRSAKEIADAEKKAAREEIDAKRQATKEALANERSIQKALKEQQKELDLTTNKWKQLKAILETQRKDYVNNLANFGSDDERTKKSLKTAQETAGILEGVNVDLRTAEGNATKFGVALTKGLSVLRNLAYILPGIGLAGIFNLAFTAIGDVIKQTGLFTNKTEQLIKIQTEYNKALKEQLSLYSSVVDKIKEISQLDSQSITNQERALNVSKQRGLSDNKILEQETILAKNKADIAADNVLKTFKSPDDIKKVLSDYLERIKVATLRLDEIRLHEDRHRKLILGLPVGKQEDLSPAETRLQLKTQGEIEDLKKLYQSQLDLANEKYKLLKDISDKYFDSLDEKAKKAAELEKFNSDEARKLLVDRGREDISVEQETTRQILSNIRSTHEERIKALNDERQQQKIVNALERINVTGTAENPNLQYTPETTEYKTAVNKQHDEDLKADKKYQEDLLKENIDFYQKQLLAEIESQKNKIEVSAINNEKISQNENASLRDRLEAYSKYIDEKTKLQELEFELASSAGKQSAQDPKSSLTQKELDKLKSDRDKQILTERSNAEDKIYGIVYSSLQKELKAIIDEGKAEGAFNDEQLIKDLENNNLKYKQKLESLSRYLRNRKKILEVDERDRLSKEIEDDLKQAKRLFDLRNKRIEDLKNSQKKVDDADQLHDSDPNKKYVKDKAVGERNADKKALEDANNEIAVNDRKYQSDRLKRAKIGYEDDGKLRKEWVDAAIQIEKALYDAVKTYGDRIYENRIALVEREKQLRDEQIDSEKDAIEKSSLNAKDKLALDIQLSEQKHEYDIAAQKEVRRLKIEEAQFDKKLAISNAIIGISAAIIRDGLTTPKSIADAIVGGIELAKIIATPVPSFRLGIDYLPKSMVARFGEAGPEEITEPGKKPYVATKETIKYLEKGTKIIPLEKKSSDSKEVNHNHLVNTFSPIPVVKVSYSIPLAKESPEFDNKPKDESWEQTRFLAKQIKKGQKEIKNIFKPTIIVDMNFESRKRQILGN